MSRTKRVTVTMDQDVAGWAETAAAEQGLSFSAVINRSVRTALVRASLEHAAATAAEADLAAAHDAEDYLDAAAQHERGAA